MDEFVAEHVRGRDMVARLVKAREAWAAGVTDARDRVAEPMRDLVDFYPKHIEKEDRRFFGPVMRYFTRFDRELVHTHYRDVVERPEAAAPA